MKTTLFMSTLAVAALSLPFVRGGDKSESKPPPLVITTISPCGTLVLGADLTLGYRIAPGSRFKNVELRVTNRMGEIVSIAPGLPADAGAHQAVWTKSMWNQAPFAGALANPMNGPYTIALSAEGPDGSSVTQTVTMPTLLVLELDLWHGKPSKDEISSGLYRPMLNRRSPECLRVGLLAKGGKLADAVYADAPPSFSQIVEADLDNDPSELEVESAHVQQAMPSSFANGVYHVVLDNNRTLAGTASNGIVPSWTIKLR